ncbi:MAG TPA: hypothetical protein VJJ79_02835 [Candidatus Nanoarchaeia archaeon]|nr:hypothetical protein [Candidatus Nanoarchaeia archaeon]
METEVKTIKGINEETWTKFKILAATKRVTMGNLLTTMVKEYEKYSNDVWDKILKSGKILSDKEASDIEKITRNMRKEKGFRNVPDF